MDTFALCRKVADIDGWAGVDTITNVGALSAVVDGKGGVMGKALLIDLMFKYEIEVDYQSMRCVFLEGKRYADDLDIKHVVNYDDVDQLPRAILECIIKANG